MAGGLKVKVKETFLNNP